MAQVAAVAGAGAVSFLGSAITAIGHAVARMVSIIASFVRAAIRFVWSHRQAIYRAIMAAMRHPFAAMTFIGDIAILIWG